MKTPFISIYFLMVSLLFDCKKEEPVRLPVLSTEAVTDITATAAISGGTITLTGRAEIYSDGVCWNTAGNPTTTDEKTVDVIGNPQFESNISGLSAGTTYHVRAYATNSAGTAYGDDITFTTLGQTPAATTQSAEVSASGVTLNGTVNGNDLPTTVTFEYGTTTNYRQTVTAAQSPVTGHTVTNVSADISGLTPDTIYHFRIKAVNSLGTVSGDDRTFTTLAGRQALSATTEPATNISASGVTLNGTVNANGLSTIVTFEYGTTLSYGQTVTAAQSAVTGNTNTNVSADISGLTPDTIYYFRIKAVNSLGTVSGDDGTFTTLAGGQALIATAEPPTNISETGVTLNGTVNGNHLPTTVTFEYGTTTNFGQTVTAAQSPVTGNSIAAVSADISGLTRGTTYHFRVKTENSRGITYGIDLTFTTISIKPTLSTTPVYDITTCRATSGGNITNDGGASITDRGVYWSKSLPIIYGSTRGCSPRTHDGSGSGSFTSYLTGLNPSTTYYIQSYAINTAGETHGEVIPFRTSAQCDQIPTVTTLAATNISATGATLNGTVNANGLSTIVTFERHVTAGPGGSWGGWHSDAVQSPLTGNSPTHVSAYSPSAGIELRGFVFRIKAENSCGTVYGAEMSFTLPRN
jgi:hypothetical protein